MYIEHQQNSDFPRKERRLFGRNVSRTTQSWLITFTDIIALMITFFVMMYAMAVPDPEKFDDLTSAVKRDLGRYSAPTDLYAGDEDTITIQRSDIKRGANLDYLQALLGEQLRQNKDITGAQIKREGERLFLFWSQENIFTPGGKNVSMNGAEMMGAMVPILTKIGNEIEIFAEAAGEDINAHMAAFAKAETLAQTLKRQGVSREYSFRVYPAFGDRGSYETGFVIRKARADKQRF